MNKKLLDLTEIKGFTVTGQTIVAIVSDIQHLNRILRIHGRTGAQGSGLENDEPVDR